MDKIEIKENVKEIKRSYSTPTLQEIGRVKDKTKGGAPDGVNLDSCEFIGECGYES